MPPIGRGGKDGGSRAKVGQVLRVIKSNCPRTIAAIDEAAGTRCLPLALPDQVGNFHLAPLEVRQDEAWGQGRGEREKNIRIHCEECSTYAPSSVQDRAGACG